MICEREYQVRGKEWYTQKVLAWESYVAGDATLAAMSYCVKHDTANTAYVDIYIPGPKQRLRAKVDRCSMSVLMFHWDSGDKI